VIPLVRGFVRDVAGALEPPDPIVEFGALQVEPGQDGDLRALFPGRAYLGTDLRPGPGVDQVEDLHALSFARGEVGTAICVETLEHVEDPCAAGRELARVVAPGGVAIVTVPMLLGIHGYPSDYFRFTPEGLRAVLGDFDDVRVLGLGDPDMPNHVVGVGANGRELDIDLARLPSLARAQARFDRAAGLVRVGPFRIPPGQLARTLASELWRIARRR
jgi:SAM-dependent methyltransferase